VPSAPEIEDQTTFLDQTLFTEAQRLGNALKALNAQPHVQSMSPSKQRKSRTSFPDSMDVERDIRSEGEEDEDDYEGGPYEENESNQDPGWAFLSPLLHPQLCAHPILLWFCRSPFFGSSVQASSVMRPFKQYTPYRPSPLRAVFHRGNENSPDASSRSASPFALSSDFGGERSSLRRSTRLRSKLSEPETELILPSPNFTPRTKQRVQRPGGSPTLRPRRGAKQDNGS